MGRVRTPARRPIEPAKISAVLKNRKRKIRGTPGDNGPPMVDSSLRISKRSRLQALPYQSPESVLKISAQFSQHTIKKKDNFRQRSHLQNGHGPVLNARVKKVAKRSSKIAVSRATTAVTSKKRRDGKISTKSKVAKASPPAGAPSTPASRNGIVPLKKQKRKLNEEEQKPTGKSNTTKSAANVEHAESTKKKPRRMLKGQLDPKPHLTSYEKDPTFESNLEIPAISSLANSRLLIRAVILKNKKLLQALLAKKDFYCTVSAPRTLVDSDQTAIKYALQMENIDALKILLDPKYHENQIEYPSVLIKHESTGHGSTRMFGHALRAVSIGRGGKEGNAAFLKEPPPSSSTPDLNYIIDELLSSGISFATLEKLDKSSDGIMSSCCYRVIKAIRCGNRDLAGKLIQWSNKRGGFGFNQLHEEVLVKNNEPLQPFKPVSVLKKAFRNARITPLHCAAINPNPRYVVELLDSIPEVSAADADQWTVLHYAAVCTGDGPIENILSNGGAFTNVVNKQGNTPLHLACELGRCSIVKRILAHEKKVSQNLQNNDVDGVEEMEDQPKKKSSRVSTTSSLIRINKIGLTPLQVAAKHGHADIVKLILSESDVDINRPTAAAFDKMTPLMLACASGRIEVVRFLVEQRERYGVKLDQADKKGRTALTYAVMNGNAHCASYLLRLGVNHLVVDSSGNTLLHYAAAYGWYFNCKLLIEAGCPVEAANAWKMTPLAAAFMKGHMGLVQMFLQNQGTNINAVVNVSNGRNLLLEAANDAPSKSFLERIKFLVHELHADVTATDSRGNNALHGLVALDHSERNKYVWRSEEFEGSEREKYLFEAVRIFIEAGCDPLAANSQGESAILLAARSGCFSLLHHFFLDADLPIEVGSTGDNILHLLSMCAEKSGSEKVLKKIMANPAQMTTARDLARKTNKDGLTPLHVLLRSSCNSREDKELSRVMAFLSFLVNKLDSDVNAVPSHESKEPSRSKESVLHMAVATGNADKILPVILAKNPILDSVNGAGETPLLWSVLMDKEDTAKKLIEAGADVNFKNEKYPSILLVYTEKKKSFSLAPTLIRKGADITLKNEETGNSALHNIAASPTGSCSVESIELILKKGYPASAVNKQGRTALHLAVNSRGGEIDVMYDVEFTLMRAAPETLAMTDIRGRVPLHYAFVKIGKFNNTSFMDPIELMAMLVRAMIDAGSWEGKDFKDNFGATPLHYAACRGSTICASLLIKEKPHWIDAVDNDSNTPFGLTVLYNHEGCALCMQQMNGKFTVPLNKKRQARSVSEEPTWTWKQLEWEAEQHDRLDAHVQFVSILEEVVRKDWQGILHLMVESLRSRGEGSAPAVHAAIKTGRLKLASKLVKHVVSTKDLAVPPKDGSLIHVMAKYGHSDPLLVTELLSKGVDITVGDEFRSNALIHAALQRDFQLLRQLLEYGGNTPSPAVTKTKPDGFGRTLFSALFWNSWEDASFENETAAFVKSLKAYEAYESLAFYPITLSPFPNVRFLRIQVPTLADCDNRSKLSPLIASVIYGHYKMVKWLLSLDGKNKVDINIRDGKGRTAIMHAARLNDMKMVKLLLLPTQYEPGKDNIPWEPSTVKSLADRRTTFNKRLDLTIRDHEGLTVVDHLIQPSEWPFTYTNSILILQLLAAMKAPMSDDSLNRAVSLGMFHLASSIRSFRGMRYESLVPVEEEFPRLPPLISTTLPAVPDFSHDAKLKAELEQEKHGKDDKFHAVPDPLIGDEAKLYDVFCGSDQPYDCILTKVDLNYGIYALYNFYKMQLLVQREGNGMILLFTRWGRVGDDGQYQKTPFGTLEEATAEFKKIFKAKSGNAWEDISGFKPMPNKYRLVSKELRNRRKPYEIQVDFETLRKANKEIPSTYSKATNEVMSHLCLVHEHRERIYGARLDELPFGMLTPQALSKGEGILKNIEELIAEKEILCKNQDHSKDEEQILVEKILRLSEEFYVTIPVFGFSSEKLQPMFRRDDVQAKQKIVQKVLHLDFATQLLLAALQNAQSTNPFDYVYSCLNARIQALNQDDVEAQLILQSIHNTCEPGCAPKVHKIFRIDRVGETERINRTEVGNRHLLWHGTKAVNLLSILTKGLQVAPIDAEISGHFFGKGIYFADMFCKSEGYCGGPGKYKFMFLCDVALGKIHTVFTSDDEKDRQKGLPASYNSVKTGDSRYEPDPGATVQWNNRTFQVGKQTEKVLMNSRQYFCLNYNEYVVFKPEQVSINYMVQYTPYHNA